MTAGMSSLRRMAESRPRERLFQRWPKWCAVTFTGLAARAGITYTKLKVDADGVAGMRNDGRFGFTRGWVGQKRTGCVPPTCEQCEH